MVATESWLAWLLVFVVGATTALFLRLSAWPRRRAHHHERLQASQDGSGHHIGREEPDRASEAIKVLYGPQDPDIDIVAVHGLGSNADWAWIWKDGDRHVHWLRDSDMLPSKVPRARILAYNYDSKWHINAPKIRLHLCGKALAKSLQHFRKGCDHPIVFIGHSLGGLVICHALLWADRENDAQDVVQQSAGFISLGTPFGGSEMHVIAGLLARVLRIAGSERSIIDELAIGNKNIWDKMQEFCRLRDRLELRTFCFFEVYQTDYGKRFGIPGMVKGMVVKETSACVLGWDNHKLDTDHLKMNKFSGPSDRSFVSVSEQIQSMCHQAIQGKKTAEQENAAQHLDTNTVLIKDILAKLPTSNGAAHNSYEDGERPQCLEGTRTELTSQIIDWMDDPNGKKIFWLCGKAGTGKSTISRTISHLIGKTRLGASFFFDRGAEDRKTAALFFPTIASQLAQRSPQILGPHIARAVAKAGAMKKNLREEYEDLFSQPLRDAAKACKTTITTNVIVVDALDECRSTAEVRTILKLLGSPEMKSLDIRIFVTSRPELPIILGFRDDVSRDLHQDIQLEDIDPETVDGDIRRYFRYHFQEIRNKKIYAFDQLPQNWPGDSCIETLVLLADRLFIFAATVCLYISDEDEDPAERLDDIVLRRNSSTSLPWLEDMYSTILDKAFPKRDSEELNQKSLFMFRQLIGSLILLADPLPLTALISLLNIKLSDLGRILKKLESVLYVPKNESFAIRILHLSFREFLVNTETKADNRFFINEVETHTRLASQCLERLSQPEILKKDICDVREPGTKREDIDKYHVVEHIGADVAYACQYWVQHIVQSQVRLQDGDQVHTFLQHHFVHWLEALSWLGRLSDVIGHIVQLQSLVQDDKSVSLAEFLEDARRFILRHRHIINHAPLQLYYSALYFTPARSMIRKTFRHDCHDFFEILPDVPANWDSEILRLEGGDEFVTSIVFSPDGKTVATADHAVKHARIWDAQTGEELLKVSHDPGTCWKETGTYNAVFHDQGTYERPPDYSTLRIMISFSSNGNFFATWTKSAICLWALPDGEAVGGIYEAPEAVGCICDVTFSADAHEVRVLTNSGIVSHWNLLTGKLLHKVLMVEWENGSFATEYPNLCKFSQDARMIARTHNRDPPHFISTIQTWQCQTGEKSHHLAGHTKEIQALAFSSHEQVLASGSRDSTVILWSTGTGEQLCSFGGHNYPIRELAFFPNESLVASMSSNGTILVWDTRTREETFKLTGEFYTTALSASGLLATTVKTRDSGARLWDVKRRQDTQRLYSSYLHKTEAMRFFGNSEVAISHTFGGEVHLWNTRTTKRTQAFGRIIPEALETSERLLCSQDRKLVAVVAKSGKTRLWNAQTGHELQSPGICYSHEMDFCSDGTRLAILANRQRSRIWNIETGEDTSELEHGPHEFITAISCSPDSDTIACGLQDGSIQMWDSRTSRRKKTLLTMLDSSKNCFCSLIGISAGEKAVASMSGFHDASGYQDRWVLHIWNTQTGEQIFVKEDDIWWYAKEIAFCHDANRQVMDVKILEIDLDTLLPVENSGHRPMISIQHHQWLCSMSQKVLWLPLEYRIRRCLKPSPRDLVGISRHGDVIFYRTREGAA